MFEFSGQHGGGLSFSALATQTFRRSSPLRHPRESGDPEAGERENKGETHEKRAINRNAPDLGSRFRGNDGKRDCVLAPMRKTHQKSTHKFFQKTIFRWRKPRQFIQTTEPLAKVLEPENRS
jgi:hypothetical protein